MTTVQSSYSECIRAARNLVTQDCLETLKAPRPKVIYSVTALLWLQLILSWAIALFGPIWLAPISFLVNCAVVQGMLLWTHEASHFTLFSDRRWNDAWTNVFFAGAIGMTVEAYRAFHYTHHAHLGTDRDEDSYPYLMDIKGWQQFLGVLAITLSGYQGLSVVWNKYFAQSHTPRRRARPLVSPWYSRGSLLLVNATLLGLCIWSGRWYLYVILWAYPIVAVGVFLNVVRSVAEHQPDDFFRQSGSSDVKIRPLVRTTVPNSFEKWLLYQANFNYHMEHHLFPAVPQHNLARLHRLLVEGGFYVLFPDMLQRSGIARFMKIARAPRLSHFSGLAADATNH